MTPLQRVRRLLAEQRVPHALIGAAALAVHGVSRATLDQDLLVMDQRVLVPAFWDPLRTEMAVDVRGGDIDDPLAGVVRLGQPSDQGSEVVVGRPRWQEAVLARAEPRGPEQLLVVQAADLVMLKLYAGGSQDRWDIEQLLALHPDLARVVDERVGELPARSREIWALWRS